MIGPAQRFTELLNTLQICAGDVVYLHTSFGRLAHLNLSADELITELLDRLGTRGSLIMPSFAWNLDKTERPWKGYEEYFDRRPVFDVRKTPANIGWVPERFRTMPGVLRSANYWWPICAFGPLADVLTQGQERIEHPYGPGSTFDLLRLNDVKIVGLGVTLNTTSLALVADYGLQEDHPHHVFTIEPQLGVVVDHQGQSIVTRSTWLMPQVVRFIKPSAVFDASHRLRQALQRADQGDVIQFAYSYWEYHEEALRLGRTAIAAGESLPWLKDFPRKASESQFAA